MTTLPKPHQLGVRIGEFDLGEDAAVKEEGEERRSSLGGEEMAKEYPDVVAVAIDTEQNRVCSISGPSRYACANPSVGVSDLSGVAIPHV